MPAVNELIDRAITELLILLHGEVSIVRDLFKRYEWTWFFCDAQLLLGILFLIYKKTDDIGILTIENTSSW